MNWSKRSLNLFDSTPTMIIKTVSRKSNPKQLINYACRYVVKEKANVKEKDAVILVRHNIRSGSSVEDIIKEFQTNESYRLYKRKDSVVLYHHIISFSPKDKEKISKQILKDISNQFIKLRAPNCLNLAVAHLEKQHQHIHIVTSGVQVNGRSSRVSKQEFTHILNSIESYQQEKYPELTNSKNRHTAKESNNTNQLIEILKTQRKTVKHSLATRLNGVIGNATSSNDFFDQLVKQNYEPYYRNGKPQGIVFEGRKHRFSSLGLDQESILDLDRKEHSFKNNCLDEINSVRKRMSPEKSHSKNDNDKSDNLEILSSIRNKSQQRGSRDYEFGD